MNEPMLVALLCWVGESFLAVFFGEPKDRTITLLMFFFFFFMGGGGFSCFERNLCFGVQL